MCMKPEVSEQGAVASRSILIGKGMQNLVDRGGYPGAAPVGYQNRQNGEGTWLMPEPDLAPLVRRAFEQVADGTRSLRAALDQLTTEGLSSLFSWL
jgi:hypothetical protein